MRAAKKGGAKALPQYGKNTLITVNVNNGD
jgi:hypothetical protein